ncbi:phosphatase PAP2 family protein [Thermococcus gorgonarius]|uniref:Phosphatidic acid phosphatase n=1 Tax=Thermococcus gorgonarius TaxID=71997 RepID=A0A2Z2M805_THEGO|nr:phosphatase PAP2 family protein [Thermococcus gorgonarius]ASJ00502.1 phosphatidic acid phosphatase [Thermococcus gorgonarius]
MAKSEHKRGFLALTLALFALLALQIAGAFNGINEWMNSILPPGGPLTSAFTETASFALTAVYIILFLLRDVKDRGKLSRFPLELTAGIAVSMVIVALLKVLIGVPRPGEARVHWSFFEAIKNVGYFAFPSGHTTRASVLAYFLAKRWKRLWPLWWAWALGIGLSRLFLHVHWFSDVLFALFLAPWTGLFVELTENRWLPLYGAFVRKLKLEVLDVE